MKMRSDALLAMIRDGKPMTLSQQLRLTVQLSVPAIIAQLSSIVMQYIDAAMVGSLGAEESAAIGLVSTTTWLFWGLCVVFLYKWHTVSVPVTCEGQGSYYVNRSQQRFVSVCY